MKTKHQTDFEAVADFIISNDDFLITTHYSPDGDAIGCSLGFAEMLKALGKTFCVSIEGGLPEKYDFLPENTGVIDPLTTEVERKYTNLVVLDAGSYNRIGQSARLAADNPIVLNIDHHPSNDGFGEVSYVDCQASSVSEIIFHLAKYMKVPIGKDMAVYLYVGIMTDTGRFRFSNTTPATFRTCAELLECGAAPADITEHIYYDLPRSYIEALGKSLYNLEFHGNGLFALMEYLEEKEIEDAEGLIDYALGIRGVRAAAFIRLMQDGRFKVSLRARDSLNVSEIAESYGGGGHTKAAGFRFRGSLSELKVNLTETILSRLEVNPHAPAAHRQV